jgi:rubredoxin
MESFGSQVNDSQKWICPVCGYVNVEFEPLPINAECAKCGHAEAYAVSSRVTNEDALTMLEHAIDYLGTRGYPDDGIMLAIGTLYEAHKAVGPLGQIPSWERRNRD